MKLHIENFAKISSADILFDGLTVIAGDNNTGKSTVGKVLYALFRGMSNIDRRVFAQRMEAVRDAFADVFKVDIPQHVCTDVYLGKKDVHSAFVDFFNQESAQRQPHADRKILDETLRAMVEMFEPEVHKKVVRARSMTDADVAWNILRRVFDCVFHGQYHPLKGEDSIARITLTLQNVVNEIDFHPDYAEVSNPTKLFARAVFLADPGILGLVNVRDFERNQDYCKVMEKYAYELVCALVGERRTESVISESGRKNCLDSILGGLDVAIRGRIRKNERGDYILEEEGNDTPTKVENLSMGLKSLVLLRMMLEKGILSNRDVLILDEPENHLHPEWQIVFARILVLLQKAYDLTLMVTSHSQFFVNALQRFSVMEGIADKAHFYVSRGDERRPGFCTFEDKGCRAGDIFRSFNRAYNLLSEMTGEFDEETRRG